jgi:hypothetical protein
MADSPESQNNIATLIEQIGNGTFAEQATVKLAKLVETMRSVERNTGGVAKGKMTIAISFKLDRGVFEVDADVKVVEPATVRGRTILWSNERGELVAQDPRQGELALSAPVRDATPDMRIVRDVKERQAGGTQ